MGVVRVRGSVVATAGGWGRAGQLRPAQCRRVRPDGRREQPVSALSTYHEIRPLVAIERSRSKRKRQNAKLY